MKHLFFVVVVCTFVFPASQGANAAEFYVPDHFPTIQSAISASSNGDTVIVRDGVFSGTGNINISFLGRSITVRSENGPSHCVIDCQKLGRGLHVFQGESRESIFQGFTIKNAFVAKKHIGNGAGIFCEDSSPTIRGCIVQNCETEMNGGGIALEHSSALIVDCIIKGNRCVDDGGGIHIYKGSPDVYNCEIVGNSCEDGGGVLICSSSSENCTLYNCLIHHNEGNDNGGGIDIHGGTALVSCCTIADNTAYSGDAISIRNQTYPIITNSILWTTGSNALAVELVSDPQISYCDIKGGYSGDGNTDLDPIFHSGQRGDYYLSNQAAGQGENSPCIDRGSVLSADECISIGGIEECMDSLTTRIDLLVDDSLLDLGYHYVCSEPTPTATPASSCPQSGVQPEMPTNYFRPGDPFWFNARICNVTQKVMSDHSLIVALEVNDCYWFAPTWNYDFNYYEISPSPGETIFTVVDYFLWPEFDHVGTDVQLWTALMNEDLSLLIGELSSLRFLW